MYTTYFGLKENPFNLTPDPRYLFLSRKHQEALSHLRYGIKDRKGFILITGNIGTGKTTLLRALLTDLDRSVKTALIFNAYISDQEILHAINHEFGIPSDDELSSKQCIDLLNEFLLQCYEKGENAVLFLDEAQNLSSKVLEQIRMLSNLETEKEKLLQIVMVGQNELRDILNASGLRQLNERIAVRYTLDTLDRKDVRTYVIHRLTVAGAKGMIHFTRWAFRALYRVSKGNPRLINAICDRALLIAYSRDRFTVDREIIYQAALNVKGQRFVYSTNKSAQRLIWTTVIVLIALIAFMGGWYIQNPWLAEWFQTKFFNEQVSTDMKPIANKPKDTSQTQLSISPETITQSNEKAVIQVTEKESEQVKRELSPKSENEQQTEKSQQLTASAIISRMTQVTGDILLEKSDIQQLTSVAKETKGLSEVTVEADQSISMTTSQVEAGLSVAITANRSLTESAKTQPGKVTKESQETLDWAIEFSTFAPFIQSEKKLQEGRLGLSMETAIPEALVQKRQQKKEKKSEMESLSFFLGEPWEQGMTAPEIMWVQRTLNDAGYPVRITGTYSRETVEAVKRLQSDFGLDVDGIIGPQSKWALYQLSTTRLKDFQVKDQSD